MPAMSKKPLLLMAIGALCAMPAILPAQSSFTLLNTTADAFMASGSASNPHGSNLSSLNFGSAGTLAIAPASSPDGEFDSVIRFNAAAAVSQFNSAYGDGNWVVTGLTLSLASNFGGQGEAPNNNIFNTINGGSFGIDWLANDTWVEGTGSGNGTAGYPGNNMVSFNSISGLLGSGYDSLNTYTYQPPGDNIYVNYTLPLDANLVSGVAGGGDVNLYFYAADNQVSYLFNARSYSQNHPELTIIATPTPEPSVLALSAVGLMGLIAARRRKK